MPGISERNPFVGPRPIQQGEPLYGRDSELRELYNRLQARRIVVLHSPSGAGKSSLVQAGLIPRLVEGGYDVWKPIRVNLDPGDLEGVPEGTNRYLLSAMISLEDELPEANRRRPAALAGLDFPEYLERRPRRRGRGNQPVVLVFDQFEEVLTAAALAVEAKRAFFTAVGQALESERYWALFLIREDHLGALAPYRDRIPTQLSNTFRLDLLGHDGAREAARSLAEMGGRSFPAVDQLVHDLSRVQVQQADGSFVAEQGLYVEPVQLQVVCRRLWDAMPADDLSIDPEDISAYASVSEALGGYYADTVRAIAAGDDVVERSLRDWVGRKLIVGGIRSQIRQEAGKTAGLDNRLIARLLDSYLVRSEPRAGAHWFELSHDRLVEPVQRSDEAWELAHLHPLQVQAKLWEDARRPAALLLAAEALPDAEAWASDHPTLMTEGEHEFLRHSQERRARERAARRRLVGLAAGAGAVAIVVGVLGVVAWVARGEALAATAVAAAAEAKALAAEKTARIAETEARAQAERAGNATMMTGVRELRGREQAAQAAGLLLRVKNPEGVRRWTEEAYGVLTTPTSTGVPSLMEWSPDDRRIATAAKDGTIRVWQADGTGAPVVLRGHEGEIKSLEWSPDGERLLSGAADGVVRVWRANGRGVPVVLRGQDRELTTAVWSPDGGRVLTVSGSAVQVWKADGDGAPVVLRGKGIRVPVSWSPDGSRVLTALKSEIGLALWSADGTGEPLVLTPAVSRRQLWGRDPEDIFFAAWSADGRRIYAQIGLQVQILDVERKAKPVVLEDDDLVVLQRWGHEPQRTFLRQVRDRERAGGFAATHRRALPPGFDEETGTVEWSPDGERMLLADEAKETLTVRRIDGKDEFVLPVSWSDLQSAEWSPDGRRIMIREGAKVRVWMADGSGVAVTLQSLRGLDSADWSPGGRYAVLRSDEDVQVWNVEGNAGALTLIPTEQRPTGWLAAGVERTAWNPKHAEILTTARFNDVAEIRPVDGAGAPVVLMGHESGILAADWSRDGQRVVTGSTDNTARVWSRDGTGDPVVLKGHTDSVTAVAWSPDGGRVLSASEDGTARVWRADGGGEPVVLAPNKGKVRSVGWSSDGKRILTVSEESSARLWSADGAALFVLAGHEDTLRSAVWSSDGGHILTLARDNTLKIWDVTGAGEPVVCEGGEAMVTSAVWSPDGRRYVVTTTDGALRVKNADGSGAPVVRVGLGAREAVWSPDGRRLLYRFAGGKSLGLLEVEGTEDPITIVDDRRLETPAWSPDSESIVLVADRTARILSLTPSGIQRALTRAATECLSAEVRLRYLDKAEPVARSEHEECMRDSGRTPPVTLYRDENFAGKTKVFDVGGYDYTAFGDLADGVSSVRVPEGVRATLYEDAGFKGRSRVLTADTPNLGDFDDLCSSLVIERE